jgi:hypothetical protein
VEKKKNRDLAVKERGWENRHAYHQEDPHARLDLPGWWYGAPWLRKKLFGFLLYSWQVKTLKTTKI